MSAAGAGLMPRTGRFAAFLVAVALAFPAMAEGGKPWRHGIIAPKADAGFYLMATKRGFTEREGLNVALVALKEDMNGLKALLAGELESYEGSPNSAILAAARAADVRIVGCHWHTIPHGLFARLGITRPADLKGTMMAAAPPGSLPDIVAQAVLASAELPLAAMKFAAPAGDRERYKALIGGAVDAAVLSNEYLPLPSSKGIKLIVEGRHALPNMIRTCIHVTARTLAAREEDAIRLLTAQMKALRFALDRREETVKLAFESSELRADDPRPTFMFYFATKANAIAPDLAIPVDKLTWMRDQLVALGMLDKPVDLSKIVDERVASRLSTAPASERATARRRSHGRCGWVR